MKAINFIKLAIAILSVAAIVFMIASSCVGPEVGV